MILIIILLFLLLLCLRCEMSVDRLANGTIILWYTDHRHNKRKKVFIRKVDTYE